MRIRKKAWARPELAACGYYIEDPAGQKGRWQEGFGEKRPLHLDLGCGKCVFLAEAARNRPDVNFVGIDISYDILGVGRRNIQAAFGEREPDNVLLCYYNIERLPAGRSGSRRTTMICTWPPSGIWARRGLRSFTIPGTSTGRTTRRTSSPSTSSCSAPRGSRSKPCGRGTWRWEWRKN